MTTKKTISILLVFAMIFSMFISAVPVSAADEHIHAICGEETCVTDHNLDGNADGLGSVEYTALSTALDYDETTGTYSSIRQYYNPE